MTAVRTLALATAVSILGCGDDGSAAVGTSGSSGVGSFTGAATPGDSTGPATSAAESTSDAAGGTGVDTTTGASCARA